MNSREYLNKNVKVIIDRKMGTRHQQYGFIYPVNYGYLPNTISGDGEELDCYVLGVFEAVDECEGKCIAIIHRLNDNDDKLIVVPDSREFSNKEIEALTGKKYTTIYVVGGGANAGYLNELTAKYTGKKVSAGPSEATAIGNIVVQMLHDGVFKDLPEARTCVGKSFDVKIYENA